MHDAPQLPAAVPAQTRAVAFVLSKPPADRTALKPGAAISPELRYVDITAFDFYREAS
jgi:hypothetical protein